MEGLNALSAKFPGLSFVEDTHTYTIDGVIYPSVSSVIGNFYKEFDSIPIATGYARKHDLLTQDVLDAWEGNAKIATDRGTLVHLFAEDYARWKYYGIGDRPKVSCKQTLGVVQFWDSLPIYVKPVALELQMYIKRYQYAGTCDILLYNEKNGEYYLADWKTNKEIHSSYPQPPLLHIPQELGLTQDSYGKYSVQFSLYQIMLESIGIKPTKRILIWLSEQPDKKLHKTFNTLDLTEPLTHWLDTHRTAA